MTYFKQLHLHNFQSHADTLLVFEPSCNVLIGASDSGKSAILRAIRWVCWNVPRGADFIRTGCTRCTVTLTLHNDWEIVRLRTSTQNRYIVRSPDAIEQVFEGFGSGVPDEVLQCHGMHPVRIEQRELFLQLGEQLAAPFLLCESGRFKAKVLGRVGHTQAFDRAIRRSAQERQSLLQERKRWEEQEAQATEALAPFANLAQQKQQLEGATQARQQGVVAHEQWKRLRSCQQHWQALHREMRILRQQVAQQVHVTAAHAAWARARQAIVVLQQLRQVQQHWQQVQPAIRHQTRLVQQLPHVTGSCEVLGSLAKQQQLLLSWQKSWQTCKKRQREMAAYVALHQPLGAIQRRLGPLLAEFQRLQRGAHMRGELRLRQRRGQEFLRQRLATIQELQTERIHLRRAVPHCPFCGQAWEQVKGGEKRNNG